jgi:hypothetical protein
MWSSPPNWFLRIISGIIGGYLASFIVGVGIVIYSAIIPQGKNWLDFLLKSFFFVGVIDNFLTAATFAIAAGIVSSFSKTAPRIFVRSLKSGFLGIVCWAILFSFLTLMMQ